MGSVWLNYISVQAASVRTAYRVDAERQCWVFERSSGLLFPAQHTERVLSAEDTAAKGHARTSLVVCCYVAGACFAVSLSLICYI